MITTTDSQGNIIEEALFTYSEEEKQKNEINRENAKLIFKAKYLIIPMSVFRDLGLSGNDAIVYAFIDSWLSEDHQRFYFTNDQLGAVFGINPITVSTILKRLKERGLIKLSYRMKAGGGQIRFLDLATSTNHKTLLKKTLSSSLANHEGNNNRLSSHKPIKEISEQSSRGEVRKDFLELTQLHKQLTGREIISIEDRFLKYKVRRQTFTKEQIMTSCKNLCSDPFMAGDNNRAKFYATLDYLLRNNANIEKYLTQKTCQITPKTPPSVMSIEI